MKRLRRILFATDFSPASSRAYLHALEMARSSGARLTIAHALPLGASLPREDYVLPRMFEEMEAILHAQASRKLQKLLARARKARVSAKGRLLRGVPHEAIVRAARSERADLVVLGTHGRTGAGRFFLGSVASRVIATAPCPVLTARGR
jgi:universal stress protein A